MGGGPPWSQRNKPVSSNKKWGGTAFHRRLIFFTSNTNGGAAPRGPKGTSLSVQIQNGGRPPWSQKNRPASSLVRLPCISLKANSFYQMEKGGAAPRGPKRTSLPVVAHAFYSIKEQHPQSGRRLAGLFFRDHGGRPHYIRGKSFFDQIWNGGGGGRVVPEEQAC